MLSFFLSMSLSFRHTGFWNSPILSPMLDQIKMTSHLHWGILRGKEGKVKPVIPLFGWDIKNGFFSIFSFVLCGLFHFPHWEQIIFLPLFYRNIKKKEYNYSSNKLYVALVEKKQNVEYWEGNLVHLSEHETWTVVHKLANWRVPRHQEIKNTLYIAYSSTSYGPIPTGHPLGSGNVSCKPIYLTCFK